MITYFQTTSVEVSVKSVNIPDTDDQVVSESCLIMMFAVVQDVFFADNYVY